MAYFSLVYYWFTLMSSYPRYTFHLISSYTGKQSVKYRYWLLRRQQTVSINISTEKYWLSYQTLIGSIGVKKSDRKTIASYFFSFLIWKISTRLASSHCFPLSPLFFSLGNNLPIKLPYFTQTQPQTNGHHASIPFISSKQVWWE